jgi:CheY-like chemotaxis protein
MIVILEDNSERIGAMREALAGLAGAPAPVFFDQTDAIIEYLRENLATAELIALDHDLDNIECEDGQLIDPGDGRDVARWLGQQEPVCPVIIHTSNAAGADSMRFALEDGGWQVARVYPEADTGWIGREWLSAVRKLLGSREDAEE